MGAGGCGKELTVLWATRSLALKFPVFGSAAPGIAASRDSGFCCRAVGMKGVKIEAAFGCEFCRWIADSPSAYRRVSDKKPVTKIGTILFVLTGVPALSYDVREVHWVPQGSQ